jgi:hypothetical protein
LIKNRQTKEELNKKVEIKLEMAQEVATEKTSTDSYEKVQIKEEFLEKNVEDNKSKADLLLNQLNALNVSDMKEEKERFESEIKEEKINAMNKMKKIKQENLSEEEKLKLLIERVKSDINDEKIFRKTKMIPVDECFRLLKEHEKKIQVKNMLILFK